MLAHGYNEETHFSKNEKRAFLIKPKEQIARAKRGPFNKCLNHTLYIICKLTKN